MLEHASSNIPDDFGRLDEPEAAPTLSGVIVPSEATGISLSLQGSAVARHGYPEEAIIYFKQALSRQPDHPQARRNLEQSLQEIRK